MIHWYGLNTADGDIFCSQDEFVSLSGGNLAHSGSCLLCILLTLLFTDQCLLQQNETMSYNSNDTLIESNYDATIFLRENSKVMVRHIIYYN